MTEQMTEAEIQQYIYLATEDLAAAQDNLRLGHLRAAVSRAYYAMFYAVTAVLGSRGLWRSKHQGVIAAFGEHLVKPGLVEPRYGRMLHDAFETRLDSDYAPQPDLNETSARNQITNAQEFVLRMVQVLAKSGETQEGDRAGE
jgi:uncharacterized protein (UPF0332 family)